MNSKNIINPDDKENLEEIQTDETEDQDNAYSIQYPCGIEAVFDENLVTVRMPKAEAMDDQNSIVMTLVDIFETAPIEADWRVDMNSIPKIPIMIIGSLVNIRNNVVQRGRKVELIGIHPQLLGASLMKKLESLFDV